MGDVMKLRSLILAIVLGAGCGNDPAPSPDDQARPVGDGEASRDSILAENDGRVSAKVHGRSRAEFHTPEWRGVNLNGTPMSAEGFEGEERAVLYDSIHVRDRDVRVYGSTASTAALRWHADFWVHVNGEPSYAEMRLLEVYVFRDGRWVTDLTQVTPVFGTVANPPTD
jgi:hypothetical protein